MAHLVVIVGVPPSIFVFMKNLLAEMRERERQVFAEVNDKLDQFLEIAARYPNLRLHVYRQPKKTRKLSSEERVQQAILFELLTQTLERAHLVYSSAARPQRDRQWRAWEIYVEDFCRNKAYRKWWFDMADPDGEVTGQFDPGFEKYMTDHFRKAANKAIASRS